MVEITLGELWVTKLWLDFFDPMGVLLPVYIICTIIEEIATDEKYVAFCFFDLVSFGARQQRMEWLARWRQPGQSELLRAIFERERERGAQDGQEDGQNCAAFLRDMVCLVKQFFDPHKNFSAQTYHGGKSLHEMQPKTGLPRNT